MSYIVSALVAQHKVGSSTRKQILAYMADKASDDGSGVWASKTRMANETELSVRSVQQNIKRMVDDGILLAESNVPCRHGFTVNYRINLPAIKALPLALMGTPAPGSPLHQVHPHPCTTFTPTPAPRSPKPSSKPSNKPHITTTAAVAPVVVGTSKKESPSRDTVKSVLMAVLSADDAAAVIDHRIAKRSKLTVRAAKTLAKQFSQTPNPTEAVDLMLLKGWTGFKAEWVENEGKRQANRTKTSSQVLDGVLDKIKKNPRQTFSKMKAIN